jgi:glucose/arabinose dehydrogenase
VKQIHRRLAAYVALWLSLFVFTNVAVAADYTLKKIVGALNQPTIATFAPGDDNDVYIAELKGANVNTLGGIVKYNRTTQTKTTIVSGLGTVSTGDGGVVGLTFNPNFASNGLFYVAYNKSDGNTFNNYLVEYHMNSDGTAAPSSRANNTGLIYKYAQLNPINYHSIDWIGFDPTATGDAQNYLYVTTGDGGPLIDDTSVTGFAKNATLLGTDVGKPYTQSPLNPYGKILRLNVDPNAADAYPADANKNFAIPAGNPLAGVGGGVLPEVVAAGFKNPFRGNFDRATGDFYVGDVGNVGREEIDFIKAGTMGTPATAFDFGWPTKEGMLDPPAGITIGAGNDYTDQDLATPMINPIQEHHHLGDGSVPANMQANAIIGGVVYHGPITSLQGKYIYGDYVTNHIYLSNFDRNTSPATFNGANLTNLQEVSSSWESLIQGNPAGKDLEFPTSFSEDSQGNLYVVSFGNSPNDSLNGGSVRFFGEAIGEIYELVALPLGDYNHNGVVDAADYTVWRDSFGQSGTGLAADGDGDLQIGPGDYNVWATVLRGPGAAQRCLSRRPQRWLGWGWPFFRCFDGDSTRQAATLDCRSIIQHSADF